jgi:transposase-like protein
MSGLNYFNESIKREVVYLVKTGQLSQKQANIRYGIRGHSTILKWIRKFEESDLQLQNLMDYNKSDKEELIKRIKELERQLEDEQIRSLGYQKMIDIAEKELKVPIKKKPGTKQSKK